MLYVFHPCLFTLFFHSMPSIYDLSYDRWLYYTQFTHFVFLSIFPIELFTLGSLAFLHLLLFRPILFLTLFCSTTFQTFVISFILLLISFRFLFHIVSPWIMHFIIFFLSLLLLLIILPTNMWSDPFVLFLGYRNYIFIVLFILSHIIFINSKINKISKF